MKLKVDDIFTITISNDEVGFGQIVALPNKSTLLIIVFDLKQKIKSDYDIEKILSSKILFLGYTLDAKLYFFLSNVSYSWLLCVARTLRRS